MQREILHLWSTLLNNPELSIYDDFFESGGDSLLATEMIMELERRIGRSVPHSLVFEASTVSGLAAMLMTLPELRPAPPVCRIGPPTGRHALLFFHGDWTNGGFYVKALGRSLGQDQPLTVVAPHGINGGPIPASLEEMAAERLPDILDVEPQGPYLLAGHCAGGMVAFETARLLLAHGHPVQGVAMIDPIWTAAGRPWPELQEPPAEAHDADIRKGQSPQRPLVDMTATPDSFQKYKSALENYVPAPLPAAIIIFSSRYDGRPWKALSPDATLIESPGDHFDWVTTQSLRFADALRDWLRRIAK
jgi:pimeloyl-ACP methyl ester carboxylesterase